jgi:hypothetical protein
MPSKTKRLKAGCGPCPQKRSSTSFNSETARIAGERSWAVASQADREQRLKRLAAAIGSRSFGGKKGGAANVEAWRAMSPQDQAEVILQTHVREMKGVARKNGFPEPVITRAERAELFVPRKVSRPSGKAPVKNKWRERRNAARVSPNSSTGGT